MANIAKEDILIGNLKYNLYDDNTAEVIGVEYKTVTSILIPIKITYENTQYTVSIIQKGALGGCNSIEELTTPFIGTDSSPYLGHLFGGENYQANKQYVPQSLKSVTCSGEQTSMKGGAFHSCEYIEEIILPEGLTHIGGWTFASCHALKKMILPNSLTRIEANIFYNCYSLQEISVPYIGQLRDKRSDQPLYPFGYWFGQVNGSNVYQIQQRYYDEEDATGKRQTITGNFSIPYSLKKITVTGGEIPYGAFENCSEVENIILSEGVTSIDTSVFYNCKKLTEMIIPNSVTYLGSSSLFYNCYDLEKVVYPNNDSQLVVGFANFANCKNLKDVAFYNNVTSIGGNAFYGCLELAELVLPNGVRTINQGALTACSKLTKLTIPFVGTSHHTYGSNPYFGSLFSNYNQQCPEGNDNGNPKVNKEVPTSLTTVIVTGQETIPGSVFKGCGNLTTISFSDTTKRIETNALANCPGLMNFKLPSAIEHLGSWALANCSQITTIEIPRTLKKIGNEVFYGTKLSKIIYNAEEAAFESKGVVERGTPFSSGDERKVDKVNIIIGPDVSIIPSYMFKKGTVGKTSTYYFNISNIVIMDNPLKEKITIEDNAFGDAIQPITVYIPKNVSADTNAFGNNITVADKEYVSMEDFVGFTYNGVHSSNLKIYRTSNGNRYDDNITAAMTDKTVDVPGGDGQYYFGTTFKNRTFTVNYVFDSLTEGDIRRIKQTFSGDGIHDLVFDERPYQVWSAKVTGTASMKHLCFEENGQRIYKGEGSITFTCYYPFAHSPTKLWQQNMENGGKLEYAASDGKWLNNYEPQIYTNISEWKDGADLPEVPEHRVNWSDWNGYSVRGDKSTTVKVGFALSTEPDGQSRTIQKIRLTEDNEITFDNLSFTEWDSLIWDTKTGIITVGKAVEGQSPLIQTDSEIISYSGNGCQTFKPGEIIKPSFLWSGTNWYVAYHYTFQEDPQNHMMIDIDYNYLYN